MPRPLARGVLLGVVIEWPLRASRFVAPAALAARALAVLLGGSVERSWGKPFSWSTLGRPSIDTGVRQMDLDTTPAGSNSLLLSFVITCDTATHLGVCLHVLHAVEIHHTEIARSQRF